MAKKIKPSPQKEKIINNKKADFLGSLILIIYGYITVLTPNLEAFDSNGPKFLALSLLNIVVFTIVVYKENYRKLLSSFFTTPVGISYGLLMLFSLVSFTKAINLTESILHFAKIFTTFSATWLVSIIVFDNKKNILPLAVAMSFLLIFDSFSVFSNISKYIDGKIKNINLIKSVYSNKNIFTSSIFIKIPFALWLMFFYKKHLKWLGIVSLFFSVLATLFMSSRAFYLALITVFVLLLIYSIIRYFQTKNTTSYLGILTFSIILIVNIIIFSFIQSNIYPKNKRNVRSLQSRIASVTDETGGGRFKIWKWSWQVYKHDPILGVGLGNWKLRVLEYENKTNSGYTYAYKSHNDFIENFCETGLFGGISYNAIFLFITWFGIGIIIKSPDTEYLKWCFLTFFGISAYFFDAFFNFPQDRPEIQALFALIVGSTSGVWLSYKQQKIKINGEE